MKKRAAPPRSSPISKSLHEPYKDKDQRIRDREYVPESMRNYMDKHHPEKSKSIPDDKLDDYIIDFDRQMQKALGKVYRELSKEALDFYRVQYKNDRNSGKYTPAQMEKRKENLFEFIKSMTKSKKDQDKLSDNVEELIEQLESAQADYEKMKEQYETLPLFQTGLSVDDLEDAEEKISILQEKIDRIQNYQRQQASKQQQKLDALKKDMEAAEAVQQEAAQPAPEKAKALTDETAKLFQSMLNASKLVLKYIPNDQDIEGQLALYAQDFRDAGNEIYQVAKLHKRNPQMYAATISLGSIVAYPWAAITSAMKENDGEVKTADWRDLLTDLRNKLAPASKDVKQVRTDSSNYVRAMKQYDREVVSALTHVPTSGKGTQELRAAVETYARTMDNLAGFARRSASDYPALAEALEAFTKIGARHAAIFKKVLP